MEHEIIIPDKDGFKIGEVSKLLGLESYVLRYWETEFKGLKPKKTKSGQRLYKREDVVLLIRIQNLLHFEQFTIAGARRQLALYGMDGPVLAEADREAMDVLEQTCQAHVATIESLKMELEIAQAEQVALDKEHQTTLNALDVLQQTTTTLEQEVDQLSRLVAQQEAQLSTAQQQHAQVDQGWDLFKQEQHEQVAQLEDVLQSLKQEHAALQGEHSTLTEAHAQLLDVQRAQEDNFNVLDAQKQAQVATRNALRQQLESLIQMTSVSATN